MKRTKTNGEASNITQSDVVRLQNLSALSQRLALANNLGLSHGGERDIYKTLGYPLQIKSDDLQKQWKRQPMARAIVDRPIKKCWQGDVSLNEPNDKDETELEKAFNELNEKLELKSKLMRMDKLAQLGDYAVLLLGFDDSSQDTWARPVKQGERELRYVRPIGRSNCKIATYENDASNPRYGKPRLYDIDLDRPSGTDQQLTRTSLKVHHTRIIHVAFGLLENEIEGNPIMKAAYNRLKDLEKLVGGSAEMFWRGARPGYHGDAKEDYSIGSDVENSLEEQLDEYENNLRRFLVTEGVEVTDLAQQIESPGDHFKIQIQCLSAVTGIPMRILIGSEQGEMASTQDDANFKEFIDSRRTEEVEPTILRPFVDRLLKYDVLPEPKDKDIGYSVEWSNLFTLGEKEKADVGQSRSNALAKYVKAGMSEEVVPLEAFLKYFLRLEDDQVEQILEMRDAQVEQGLEEEEEMERIEQEQQEIEEQE